MRALTADALSHRAEPMPAMRLPAAAGTGGI